MIEFYNTFFSGPLASCINLYLAPTGCIAKCWVPEESLYGLLGKEARREVCAHTQTYTHTITHSHVSIKHSVGQVR